MSTFLSAVIPAAGSSRRLGFNKLLTFVGTQTFLELTLSRILQSPYIKEIILVIPAESAATVAPIVKKIQDDRPIKIIHGGAERQDSVYAGLQATDGQADFIMIHDAARPFVTADLIEAVFKAAQESGAAVCGRVSTDTMKTVSAAGEITQTLDRNQIWSVQTPQIFRRAWVIDAYTASLAAGDKVTDDTAAVAAAGHPVKVVSYDGANLKITGPGDWAQATKLAVSIDDDLKSIGEIRKLIHDISNQITSVMGFSYLLDMDVPEDSPMKSYVNALNEASQKSHAIIQNMQSTARDIYAKKAEILQTSTGQAPKNDH